MYFTPLVLDIRLLFSADIHIDIIVCALCFRSLLPPCSLSVGRLDEFQATLPCGHVFGHKCVHSFLRSRVCPLATCAASISLVDKIYIWYDLEPEVMTILKFRNPKTYTMRRKGAGAVSRQQRRESIWFMAGLVAPEPQSQTESEIESRQN